MVNGNYEVDVTVNMIRVDLHLKDSQKLVWKISYRAGCHFCRMQSWAGAFCLRSILCLWKPDQTVEDERKKLEELGEMTKSPGGSKGPEMLWRVKKPT